MIPLRSRRKAAWPRLGPVEEVSATTGQPHHGPVVHLADTPPGLTARFVQRTRRQEDGTQRIVHTGGRRLRDTHVDLLPGTPPDPAAFDQLLVSRRHDDRSFILGASSRTWTTIRSESQTEDRVTFSQVRCVAVGR